MKHIFYILIFLLGTLLTHGQTLITSTDISNTNASEGDLYKDSSGAIYIGLSSGVYHPINKNLQEILVEGNSANDKKITNLGAPTDPKDAVTKEYVDNHTGSGSWKLTGNAGTTNSDFIGTTDEQDLVFKSFDIEKLRLVKNKNQVLVNSATSFNNHPLVIRANGNDVLAFEDESGVPKWHWNLLANGLNFVESGILDFRLFLKNGGNVGINTNNPTAKLHVAGDMQLDQAFKDKDGDVGVSGQILSSTSTGTDWITNVTGDNIYNADGNLTEDRSINGAGTFNLNFDALNFFRVNTVDEIILTAQTFTTINAPSGIILKNRVRINGMLSGDNWNGGIAGQILSSTGTNIEWIDNTSANSIYTTNGTLTTDRILEGNTNSLSFENLGTFTTNVINRVSNSTNTQIFATNAIQLQSTGGTVQIAGPSGIQLQNNTAVAGNLSVTGSYNDSTTDSGITGEVLSSTGTGTDWHPLVSTDANNAVTTGTDKGVYVKKQQIIFLTKESNTTQTWNNPDTQVESHTIELFEESIVNLNYIFTFRRNNGNGGRYRGVNIDISGSTSLNNQMSTLTNTYSNSEIWGTCAASRNFKLIPGTYTFSMRTFGNHNCTTQSQSNNMYGWSFDITATPIN